MSLCVYSWTAILIGPYQPPAPRLCSWGLELVRVFVDKATRNLFAFLALRSERPQEEAFERFPWFFKGTEPDPRGHKQAWKR